MEFQVIHEVKYQIVVEAASQKEAEQIADETTYDDWDRWYVIREECVPLGESPVNPFAG